MKKLFITNSINSNLSSSFLKNGIDILDRKKILKLIEKIGNSSIDISDIVKISKFELMKEFIIRSNLNISFNFNVFYQNISKLYKLLWKEVDHYDFIYIEEDYHIISSIIKNIILKKKKKGVILSRSLKRNITPYKFIYGGKEFIISEYIDYNNNDNIQKDNDIFINKVNKNNFLLDKNLGFKRDIKNFLYFEKYYNSLNGIIICFIYRSLITVKNKLLVKKDKFNLINEKYLFLPLQTLYDSHNLFSNIGYEEIIDYILKSIKNKDLKLIIKEHPLQAFDYSFKEKYIKNKKIIWLDRFTKANTIELMENSIINLTLNSTAGLESIYLDRPTYVFGIPFYYDYRYASYLYGKIDLANLIYNLEKYEKEYKMKRKKFRIGYYNNFLIHEKSKNFKEYFSKFNNLIEYHWEKIIGEKIKL